MRDFALLANQWFKTDCQASNNWCSGADFDQNNSVDSGDLKVLADNWLEGISPTWDFTGDFKIDYADLHELTTNWLSTCSSPGWCDGTDLDKSGSVNFDDFAIFSEHWLEETEP